MILLKWKHDVMLRMTRGTVARSVANMSSAESPSNSPIARDGLSWQPSAWRSCVLFGMERSTWNAGTTF